MPSDGFYEWRRTGGTKQPYFLHPPEGAVLAMAGLWAIWKDPGHGLWVPSAAVITTAANRRGPPSMTACPCCCRVRPGTTGSIPGSTTSTTSSRCSQPAPDDVLEMYPISTAVNNVRNKGPELLEPLEETEAPTLQLGD